MKKKTTDQGDPHVREAHIAEGFERHVAPAATPLSATAIPMPVIAPSPVLSPKPAEFVAPLKNELKIIKGIDDETASKLNFLGIENIDDLAKATGESLARDLKIPATTVQKWIDRAKQLQ